MEIDKSNMRQVIMGFPGQLGEGLMLAKNVTVSGKFNNVIICGIGGSALPAEILIDLQATKIPLFIHRNYDLPPQPGKNSLVICISYSGNTEETVSALEAAIAKKMHVVVVSSGGKLEALAQNNHLPFVKIPAGIQPRSATGYIFGALVGILENTNIIKGLSQQITQTVEDVADQLQSHEKQGKGLATQLAGKIPVIYASGKFSSLAKIWKIKFNENSKVPAYSNYFPELNHNEMVGYEGIANTKAQNLHIITLRDMADHPRILRRMDLTAAIIEKSGVKHTFVDIQGETAMQKIFSTLILGDWASYYLALEYGIDPTPVTTIEDFKKSLR